MTSTDAPAEARETVYAAIELSKKTWMLGIAHPDRDRPSIHRVCGGNIAELVRRLRVAAGNKRRILVCYEAGYDGFWLARALAKIGIEVRCPGSCQHPGQSPRPPRKDRPHRRSGAAARPDRDRSGRTPRLCHRARALGRGRRCSPLASRASTSCPRTHGPYQSDQGIAVCPGYPWHQAKAAPDPDRFCRPPDRGRSSAARSAASRTRTRIGSPRPDRDPAS
jgi:hypothetical protein